MNNDQAEEVKTVDLEIAPIESITKAEVSQQIATAKQYPRSLAQFYKRCEAMVTIDQETAESCFYQLKRKDKNSPGGYKIIEGESVRMAEIVASCYGNLRSAVHIVGHTPLRVSVRAVCHDLETNNLIAVEKQAKTTYSDGTPYSEDMAITTANAVVSKALRDAIFRVVPKALIKPLKEKAKLVAFGEGAAFAERRKKAVQWATLTRKVPIDRVMAALGVKGEEDITIDHLALLTGLKTAIMDGDQTVEEAFPSLDADSGPFETPGQNPKKVVTETKSEPKTEPAAKQTVKTEPKAASAVTEPPKPANVVQMPETKTVETKTEEKELADTGLAPVVKTPTTEPQVVKEELFPADTSDPATELEPDKPENTAIGEKQLRLKEEVEGRGYTFAEFSGWMNARRLFNTNNNPADFAGMTDAQAGKLIESIKGVAAGIKEWKAKLPAK